MFINAPMFASAHRLASLQRPALSVPVHVSLAKAFEIVVVVVVVVAFFRASGHEPHSTLQLILKYSTLQTSSGSTLPDCGHATALSVHSPSSMAAVVVGTVSVAVVVDAVDDVVGVEVVVVTALGQVLHMIGHCACNNFPTMVDLHSTGALHVSGSSGFPSHKS